MIGIISSLVAINATVMSTMVTLPDAPNEVWFVLWSILQFYGETSISLPFTETPM